MQAEKLKEKPKRKNTPRKQRIARIAIISGLVLITGLLWTFRAHLFPMRLQIAQIEAITINDSWTGMFSNAPFNAQYELMIQDGMLVGTSTFSSGYRADRIYENVISPIPAEVVEEFIRKLEEAHITPGKYRPLDYQEWVDDYPNISITIQTSNGTIEIFTQSQGEEHIPWAANVRSEEYLIHSAIPSHALDILQPYLLIDIPDTPSEASNFILPE
jgi:hypothetical protein